MEETKLEFKNFIKALENEGYTKPKGESAFLQQRFGSYEIDFVVRMQPVEGFRVDVSAWYVKDVHERSILSIKFRDYNTNNIETAHREIISAIKEVFIPRKIKEVKLPEELEAKLKKK